MSNTGVSSTNEAVAKEQEYVHTVYDEIASHFSHTRYKPWPIVEKFLVGLKPGSVGIDVGCGNGKYLGINKNVFIMGSDHSGELIKIAQPSLPLGGFEVSIADGLSLPYTRNRFDFAICIAVIHHFSTPARRIEAVQHILNQLNVDGEALVYVWALEQKNSRRGWDEGMVQDVMVPWVLQKQFKKGEKQALELKKQQDTEAGVPIKDEDEVKHRYYHLYKQNELENDVVKAGGIVVDNGYERDNWWAIIKNQPQSA
ncbi:S-adenosyl-L-methionine-dependent methyltransferase [Nadsonia fulvescens var. elongata DSM 6958]|uniref:S-adenosyl-L-methionine-dependent methyltransferase n=1 Tax=Nadsonia fulvescens var. elongata DSM 6958 TaxID=857566 RepID=A0A1E3PQU1_9ASCO|nr:S-adenosyl-L-methionine-dependent methyltransferase [Nadsonia fulvescens var. elongata DSM 6958]